MMKVIKGWTRGGMGGRACNVPGVGNTSEVTDQQAVQPAEGSVMSRARTKRRVRRRGRRRRRRRRRRRMKRRERMKRMERMKRRARMLSSLWSRLPEDLIERVLAFLPLPALFRCRSVCTKWNELPRQQRFLAEWDRVGGRREYLFVTRYLSFEERESEPWDCNSYVDDDCWLTTCFLDLDERRWYSMPTDASLSGPNLRDRLLLYSIDGGLVCEFSWLNGVCNLGMLDPVANMRRMLPYLVTNDDLDCHGIPMVVTVVDDANCSFKVVLMRRYIDSGADFQAGFVLYESTSDTWRGLIIPPAAFGEGLRGLVGGLIGETAAFFQGQLYVVVRAQNYHGRTYIVSYNMEENLCQLVLALGVVNPEHPQLIVSGHRMFVSMWSMPLRYSPRSSVFEIREIFVGQGRSRQLVRIPYLHLGRISGEPGHSIQYGFPLSSNTYVLLTRRTGRLLIYDQSTDAVGAFPAYPLRLSDEDAEELDELRIFPRYRARLSNLSLRNILRVPA